MGIHVRLLPTTNMFTCLSWKGCIHRTREWLSASSLSWSSRASESGPFHTTWSSHQAGQSPGAETFFIIISFISHFLFCVCSILYRHFQWSHTHRNPWLLLIKKANKRWSCRVLTALRTSSLCPSTPPKMATSVSVWMFHRRRAWSKGKTQSWWDIHTVHFMSSHSVNDVNTYRLEIIPKCKSFSSQKVRSVEKIWSPSYGV